MPHSQGCLDLQTLSELAKSDEIDTVIVGFTDHYGRLMGKRLDIGFFLEQCERGIGACNYLLTVDMEMEPVEGYEFSNWDKGYGDFLMMPDLSTLRVASWLDKTALVICDLREETSKDLIAPAPRSLLSNIVKRLKEVGFEAKGASELEYYLYEDSFKESARKNYQDLKALGWYIEDYHLLQGAREEFFNAKARQHLKKSGIPVENSKGEFGLGQHELNICYTSPLEMADRHVIYKQCLKELADQMDIAVTFMAKCDEEQAGSSCHMHISLWKDGTNAFLGEQALGALQCSDTFRWFLGGWMQYTPELMPFYAPTINSYKRFQDASWAPTRLAWSVDNRSSGFRILNHGDNLRIECRIPGADCNPYLAFAAALASGLEGIKRKIEPPPVYQGDVYANKDLPELPKSLYAANHLFKNSQFARDAFGKEAHEHYVHHFSKEQQAYDKAVTNWELKRYFERI